MAAPLYPRVAYFCMEFGLAAELPIYSGGLGILAGDHIKSAGDLKLPIVGLGILWSEGYTVQKLRDDGVPVDEYPVTPRTHLEDTGLRVTVTVRGKDVPLAAWKVGLPGIASLYLLEPAKDEDRWITRRLYAGGADDRIAQELVLGVGGVRLCRALGLPIDVYHFNEGHAVFAGLELIRERMAAGEPFGAAHQAVRPHIVFTTHTPVVAGNETHPIEQVVAGGGDLGHFTREQLVAIGGDPFGMTVAGLRLARIANAVAELHGETSRAMWKAVEGSAPIVAVTNGVHPPSWQDERIKVGYAMGNLWEVHRKLKVDLLAEVARRTRIALDPDVLLIGFARRAATYKRADLILRDPALAERLFAGGQLQVLFAGKAHPQDLAGKRIVAQLAAAARRWRGKVVFLENYEMELARHLVRGCDVWLNNPRRPLEASGTSGMKAAMNGVLNVSVLDGWWPEGCEHGVNGWQVGGGEENEDTAAQDEHDRQALGDVLEKEVLPAWRAGRAAWEPMMKKSIEMAQWKFSSYRMLEDYYRDIYRA